MDRVVFSKSFISFLLKGIYMQQHLNTIREILQHGETILTDRSGSGMRSVIGIMEKYPLLDGSFPLVTTRKINFTKTLHELIWFIKGTSDVTYLEENKVPFWTKWTTERNIQIDKKPFKTIGPMYPEIWRKLSVTNVNVEVGSDKADDHMVSCKTIDQLKDLVVGLARDIQYDVISRRHYISNVNLGMRPFEKLDPITNVKMGHMALDTCHREFFVSLRPLTDTELEEVINYRENQAKQFGEVDNRPLPKYKLMTSLTMRSNDVAIGKPHNIAQYACMNFILAHILNCHPGEHTHMVHDAHIYLPHIQNIKEQLSRTPYPSPKLYLSQQLTKEKLLSGDIDIEWFKVVGYQSHPAISFSLEG